MRSLSVPSSPVRDLLALTSRPEVISFAGGLPAPELFDLDGLRAAADRALTRRTLQYAPTEGDADLREQVAARLTARGLPTRPDELLITTGSQQALALVVTALLEPGSVVAVEEPTYLAALQCFHLAGARVVAVPGDERGIDPVALAEVVERDRPELLYLVPTFANPTGRTLDAERRAEVLRVAERSGLRVLEDDPYSELRYRGDAVPALAASSDLVLHLGTFSKIGAPGLRVGWLRAPEELMPALVVTKQAADLHTSAFDQAVVADYLRESDLDAHVRRLCATYRERRDALVGALAAVLPEGTVRTDPDGGMFVWVRLPGEVDAAVVLRRALERDVAFVPGASFYAGEPDRATMRLSFTTGAPEVIREGVRRLGEVL
ncbi:PLP-dependent aminotransferase family protein [Actinosynnema pretiosum subsp. pretiosum]|uniref:PLP-dependent aminotransferase family protein n=1 Tax=Actinosynnema pretiosum subsp. pretiosum TaxID=103721 RepID=A0AA45R2Z0_9PSEU|nr:Transcriptional regulator, GntR family domain [Actinosynnema pretiosum subsp. pretiosum]QUF03229.1 PLP-dependent aminotransferase family protein [Actinosynnema pretiosum subsp. pretiosum]